MTAEVIELRKPKPKQLEQQPQFYCRRCDGGTFTLLANGDVYCACGSLMRNLEVKQKT